MGDTLAPCPFCLSDDAAHSPEDNAVVCGECGARGPTGPEDWARAAWNWCAPEMERGDG